MKDADKVGQLRREEGGVQQVRMTHPAGEPPMSATAGPAWRTTTHDDTLRHLLLPTLTARLCIPAHHGIGLTLFQIKRYTCNRRPISDLSTSSKSGSTTPWKGYAHSLRT